MFSKCMELYKLTDTFDTLESNLNLKEIHLDNALGYYNVVSIIGRYLIYGNIYHMYVEGGISRGQGAKDSNCQLIYLSSMLIQSFIHMFLLLYWK